MSRQNGTTQDQLNTIAAANASSGWDYWNQQPEGVGWLNGWGNYDNGPYGPVKYRKNGAGVVQWSGLIAPADYTTVPTGAAQDMLLIPVGYRPTAGKNFEFTCMSFESPNFSMAILAIIGSSSDRFTWEAVGGRQWISLNSIQYIAEH